MRFLLTPFFLCILIRIDEDAEKIVKKHITLLHRYNEAKDATQVSFEVGAVYHCQVLKNFFSGLFVRLLLRIDSNWKGTNSSSLMQKKKRSPELLFMIHQLASLKETTIRKVHDDYGLTDDD